MRVAWLGFVLTVRCQQTMCVGSSRLLSHRHRSKRRSRDSGRRSVQITGTLLLHAPDSDCPPRGGVSPIYGMKAVVKSVRVQAPWIFTLTRSTDYSQTAQVSSG